MPRFPALLAAALALAAPAVASAQTPADYASDLRVTLTGTVSSFDWTDAKCAMTLMVPLPNGGVIAWNLELAPPAELKAHGWKPNSIKKGNTVELEVKPSLDGTTSGYVLAARKSGKPIGEPLDG